MNNACHEFCLHTNHMAKDYTHICGYLMCLCVTHMLANWRQTIPGGTYMLRHSDDELWPSFWTLESPADSQAHRAPQMRWWGDSHMHWTWNKPGCNESELCVCLHMFPGGGGVVCARMCNVWMTFWASRIQKLLNNGRFIVAVEYSTANIVCCNDESDAETTRPIYGWQCFQLNSSTLDSTRSNYLFEDEGRLIVETDSQSE